MIPTFEIHPGCCFSLILPPQWCLESLMHSMPEEKNHAFILHFSREEKELGKIMNMKDMHALDNIIAPKSKYGFALLIV